MALKLTHAKNLAKTDSNAVLRALMNKSFLANPDNLEAVKEINAANEEMDRAGDLGLTVSFSDVQITKHGEGIWSRWFGASGEFYVITTAIDGSGKPFEYKTQYFQGIKRDDHLPLGDGGMLVAYLKNPKWFIDLHMIVMESDSDIRDLGKTIEKAKKQTKLDEIINFTGSAMAFDPTLVSKFVNGVDLFLNTLTYLLKTNGDDHIATVHDFYLKHQAFGEGKHPDNGVSKFQGVEVAYEIHLSELGQL